MYLTSGYRCATCVRCVLRLTDDGLVMHLGATRARRSQAKGWIRLAGGNGSTMVLANHQWSGIDRMLALPIMGGNYSSSNLRTSSQSCT